MAPRYEVEVTVISAKDLKNVNWRNGRLKPYAVVWIDSHRKHSTRVDEEGDTSSPEWNHKLVIPFSRPINDEDSILYIDIVHAFANEDTKPLIGSAKLRLKDLVDEVGLGGRVTKKLQLKRPSGRPQGKVKVDVVVRETGYRVPNPYHAPPPYGFGHAPPYGQTGSYGSGEYGQAVAHYDQPITTGSYGSGEYEYGQAAVAHYDQPGYGQPAVAHYDQPSYGQAGYGQPASYGSGEYGQVEKEVVVEEKKEKKSRFGKMGMGTGLAVGAAAGVAGGLGLAYGIHKLEDHLADEAAEKVEADREAELEEEAEAEEEEEEEEEAEAEAEAEEEEEAEAEEEEEEEEVEEEEE